MGLSVTKTSGSTGEPGKDEAVPVEDGKDLLRDCAGGCGNKILIFGVANPDDWGASAEGAICLACRLKPLKHTPQGRKS